MKILRTNSASTIFLTLVFIHCQYCYGQWPSENNYDVIDEVVRHHRKATWCTVSKEEQTKCEIFAQAIEREKAQFGRDFLSLNCTRAFNKEECMTMVDFGKADLITLDPGEVFVAGRYHSLVPIMQEIYDDSGANFQYAVALIKRGTLSEITRIEDLRGKKACFAGVGTLSGWITPLYALMRSKAMEIIDCNNHVKSASKFFGSSCAVNSLVDLYNPLGDNSDQLCQICSGKTPGQYCTDSDPYAGYEGAFRCLLEAGEVAFLSHTVVQQLTTADWQLNSVTKDKFELLCGDGSRRSVDEYRQCNWGKVPSRGIVVSSATDHATRQAYQFFLERAVKVFGKASPRNTTNFLHGPAYDAADNNNNNNNNDGEYNGFNDPNNNNNWSPNNADNSNYPRHYNDDANIPGVQPLEMFDLFESAPKYGQTHNLLFSDAAKDFVKISETQQTYAHYLGEAMEAIMGIRRCTVDTMKLCVTSEPEMEKCKKMKAALRAQILKPELVCYKGYSHIRCMQAIREGLADVTVLDASDVYTAGQRFGLVPVMSETYNLPTPEYYVVAVAKDSDPSTDITYLKDKYTCHSGINTAAGWVYPMAYLLSNEWIRGYGCDSIRAAAEYFTKSCVPGAVSNEYNDGVPPDTLCGLCHGTTFNYCRRDASEDFYGHTGAFRCLVEGGGDVAFVKHTTVGENTNGKRRETWAREKFDDQYQLLCPDGKRRESTDYENCNLGKVKANAIVTRPGNDTQINAYINLFIYAQQFYGQKQTDQFSFSMFYSLPPYSDLIFQDATQQLLIISQEEREYGRYLGEDFLRARKIVDCTAGAAGIAYSIFATFVTIFFTFMLSR